MANRFSEPLPEREETSSDTDLGSKVDPRPIREQTTTDPRSGGHGVANTGGGGGAASGGTQPPCPS